MKTELCPSSAWYVCVHKVRYMVYCCYCFRIIITNFRNDFFLCTSLHVEKHRYKNTDDDEDLSSSGAAASEANLKRSDDIHEHNNSIKNRYENSHAPHSHTFFIIVPSRCLKKN